MLFFGFLSVLALTMWPLHFGTDLSHFLEESKLPYLIWKGIFRAFIWPQLLKYLLVKKPCFKHFIRLSLRPLVGVYQSTGLLLYGFLILATRGQGNFKLHSFSLPLAYPSSLFRAWRFPLSEIQCDHEMWLHLDKMRHVKMHYEPHLQVTSVTSTMH